MSATPACPGCPMLSRTWTPSPNCSSGGHQGRIVCVHTSEGSTTQEGLASFLAQPSSGVSYHTCFDDYDDPNEIVECVEPSWRSWSALDGNSWGVHGCLCTPSGASYGWTREVWLSKPKMLGKCAAWISEECARFGIPVRKISGDELAAGASGVCGHAEVSYADGGDHGDPGPAFPWDHVIALATGGAPPEEADLTPEEHTLLVQIHESIPMARETHAAAVEAAHSTAGTGVMNEYQNTLLLDIQRMCTDIAHNVAGTGPMNGYQNDLLNQILTGVNTLLSDLGKDPMKTPKPPAD